MPEGIISVGVYVYVSLTTSPETVVPEPSEPPDSPVPDFGEEGSSTSGVAPAAIAFAVAVGSTPISIRPFLVFMQVASI